MYDAQSQFLVFYAQARSAAVEFESSGRDATIYQSHFSRKRVVLAFPLKSYGAEDSREPRGEEEGTRRRAKWKKMYRSPTEVNERHGAWHYSPLPSPPRRAGVPRFYVAASARGSHSLARRRGGTSGAVTVGHVFAHSALRRCPSPFPSRVVRCKHAAGVRQVAANARTARIRSNLTSRRVR